MKEVKEFISNIKCGDRQLTEGFIHSTRLFSLNLAKNLVNDDGKAIEVVKEAYEDIILSDRTYSDDDSLTEILRETINEKASAYNKTGFDLSEKTDDVPDKYHLDAIDIDKYRNFYDQPRVENEINQIINSLDEIEKNVLIQTYYSGGNIDEVAEEYQTSKNTIQYYLNKANDKISEIDFEKVALVYSVISLGINVMKLDFVGIGISAAKDKVKDKLIHEERSNSDFKSFVNNLLQDSVEDWFLDRIRSIVTTTVASGTVKTLSSRIKSFFSSLFKTGKSLFVKKAAITATAAVVTVGGGYAAYKEIVRNEALNYMQETFHTDMFDSNRQVTAGDLRQALQTCWGLDRYFAYDEGMSDDTELDDFFLFWPLVKYYWPEVENNWDVIDWSKYPDSEWYPGIIASEIFIEQNDLNKGYNSKAKGIIMKDFAILIMNCDKFYKQND